ncbi:uncharacterized protein [Centruroides vittatus]|uniref:uncharacterized protein n=1 Tax=Centruroides vittatus TaxID=120091 RepID=UPI0035108A7E
MISFTLICLMSILIVVNSYTARMVVPNVDGKCDIKGKLIKSEETYYEEEKCEAWICSAPLNPITYKLLENGTIQPIYDENAYVEILGCGVSTIEKDGKICPIRSIKGKYPECCKGRIVCP